MASLITLTTLLKLILVMVKNHHPMFGLRMEKGDAVHYGQDKEATVITPLPEK